MLAGAGELESVILEQHQLVSEGMKKIPVPEGWALPGAQRTCKLVIGEWGNWHRPDRSSKALWQQCTMRDALTSALTLDILHRNADKVSIACAAQTVNVLNSALLTFNDATIRTPNFHVYKMYMPHRNAQVLPCSVDSKMLYSGVTDVFGIHSFASLKDGIVTVNVVNASYADAQDVTLEFDKPTHFLSVQQLGGIDPTAHNTPGAPNMVAVHLGEAPQKKEGGIVCTFLRRLSTFINSRSIDNKQSLRMVSGDK